MSYPTDIITEAREWVGTPFLHQGRVKGSGVDCAGLVIGVLNNCGYLKDGYEDITNYSRSPNPRMMKKQLLKYLKRVYTLEPGTILYFTMPKMKEPQHLAIYTDSNTIIHAADKYGKVIEHTFSGYWPNSVRGMFTCK